MPWVECLLFIAVVYIVIVFVRGIAQGITWFREEFLSTPRERNRARENFHQPHRGEASASGNRGKNGDAPRRSKSRVFISLACFNPLRCLAPLVEFAKRLLFRKRYDFWVATALGENDPCKQVKYYSMALKLDPSYESGWKLKAAALIQLKRYAEAMECYDKVLEMHPNATTWCKKGTCCHHLKRHGEAIACFDKALAACPAEDHQLFEEVSRHRKAVEEELQQQGATEGFVTQHGR